MKVSLRAALVAMLLLATVPIATLMGYQLLDEMRDEQRRMHADLAREALALSQAVDQELAASIEVLRVLGMAESLRAGDVREFERGISARGPLRRGWKGSFLTDTRGLVIFDTTGAARRGAPAPVPGYRQMLWDRAPMVSGLVVHRPSGQLSTVIAVPVVIDGELRFGLGVWVPWAAWQWLLKGATPALGYSALVDREGRVIARSVEPDPFVGRPLPDPMWPDEATYDAVAAVPSSGWGVRRAVAAEPVLATQRRSIAAAWATAAACLLLGVTMALVVAHRVTRPLGLLARDGGASPGRAIHVREIAALRDALLAARERDQAARDGLQRKADEFETLFNSSPIGLSFAQDRDCANVMRNAAMGHLFGPTAGADAPEVYHLGERLPDDQMPLCIAARTGQAVAMMELEFRWPSRPAVHAIANAVPLRDAQGRPRGAIAAMVDITARKQAEARLTQTGGQLLESQRLLDLAQEAGHVGFFTYEFDTDALAWTPGQAKLFGREAGFESTLAGWIEKIHAGDQRAMEAVLLRALAVRQESATLEYQVDAGDEAPRWLSTRVSLAYHPDGQPQRMVGVSLDITDRRLAEQAAAELMEREQAARRLAEAANRAKDEFLAMLGHELRNPLSAISAAVEVLNHAQIAGETARSAREIIGRQTLHLAHMMGDLLDVTRVISGKVMLSRQPVDLAMVVRRAIESLSITGDAALHEVVADLQVAWVEADPTRMEQVVTNLVGNALKYTPPGRRITVTLRAQDSEALLVVADNGDGIPPELLPRVFDLFVQGERGMDRRGGGLGIGLTLVKRLVDLHGGTVSAASSSAGSTFEVRLPLVEPVPARSEPNTGERESGLRVLVVEDNADALRALCDLLTMEGHEVLGEHDGRRGLAALLTQWPDVAVVDIGLPELDGMQLARQARAQGYSGRMVAMTGYGQAADTARAMKAGFDAHLVKPVDAQQLRQFMRDSASLHAHL